MKKNELLTKEEIGKELSGDPESPLSIRSVERYIQLAEVVPAVKGSGRGNQAKYRRADVEKIKTAYHKAAELREQQSTALTTTKPAAVALVELITQQHEERQQAADVLRTALDAWPIWMPKAEALERTGLPVTWFDAGVQSEHLAHVGSGRARRFHRDDLRAFAEKVRDSEYLKDLLEGKFKKPDA